MSDGSSNRRAQEVFNGAGQPEGNAAMTVPLAALSIRLPRLPVSHPATVVTSAAKKENQHNNDQK
jgi:hypothetical protein